MQVRRVISKVGNAITYEFTDGSTGVLDMVKDNRGFLVFGPAHSLTPNQFKVVAEFNLAEKPDGGWL